MSYRGMSETSFAPKIAPVKSCSVDQKKFPLCQNLALFPQTFAPLQFKILVLTCWNNTVKMSYKPLTRILARGSFNLLVKASCPQPKPWVTFGSSLLKQIVRNVAFGITHIKA